jgi:hypothetical protein
VEESEGRRMKLGDKVTCTARYLRSRASEHRKWYALSMRAREGMYIGTRTLANGIAEWEGEDEGMVFQAGEYFRVALVVFSERENPVYVPLAAIEKVAE